MKTELVLALFLALAAAGCHTASEARYAPADFNTGRAGKKHFPGPQLSEASVLGLKSAPVTDAEIASILDKTRSLKIAPGSSILLVESGSPQPDAPMTEELSRHFRVVSHTGVPSELTGDEKDGEAAKALRLAAAHSGSDTVLVYWGQLEMRKNDLPTEIVSWVPVVDFMVPDQYQRVRMSLRVAVLDVRTGQAAVFRTAPIENDLVSTRYAREHNTQWPLDRMRRKLYQTAVADLLRGYTESAATSVRG
jgi:hypothetical protein